MNNFESIITPSDLVELNKKVDLTAAQKAVEALEDCDYLESKAIIEWLLSNIITFHQKEAIKCLNGETPADSIQWIEDVAKFSTAKKIIDDIA